MDIHPSTDLLGFVLLTLACGLRGPHKNMLARSNRIQNVVFLAQAPIFRDFFPIPNPVKPEPNFVAIPGSWIPPIPGGMTGVVSTNITDSTTFVIPV